MTRQLPRASSLRRGVLLHRLVRERRRLPGGSRHALFVRARETCQVGYQFVNADHESTNGCECAAQGADDEPDLSPTYPTPGLPYVDRTATTSTASPTTAAVRLGLVACQPGHSRQPPSAPWPRPWPRSRPGCTPPFSWRRAATSSRWCSRRRVALRRLLPQTSRGATWCFSPRSSRRRSRARPGCGARSTPRASSAAPCSPASPSAGTTSFSRRAGAGGEEFLRGVREEAPPGSPFRTTTSSAGAVATRSRRCGRGGTERRRRAATVWPRGNVPRPVHCAGESQAGGPAATNASCAAGHGRQRGRRVDRWRRIPQDYSLHGHRQRAWRLQRDVPALGARPGGVLQVRLHRPRQRACRAARRRTAATARRRAAARAAAAPSGAIVGGEWVTLAGPRAPRAPPGGAAAAAARAAACATRTPAPAPSAIGWATWAAPAAAAAQAAAAAGAASARLAAAASSASSSSARCPPFEGNLIDLGFGGGGGNGGAGGYGGLGGPGGRGGQNNSIAWCAGPGRPRRSRRQRRRGQRGAAAAAAAASSASPGRASRRRATTLGTRWLRLPSAQGAWAGVAGPARPGLSSAAPAARQASSLRSSPSRGT